MKKVTTVFWVSIGLSIIFVLWGAFFPVHLGNVMDVTLAFFLENFGWFYQLAATFFLIFALFLIFSKYGKIKLGKDDDKPEFNRPTWFAMLFSAGMGIGLLFFGVSEPISHFASPPFISGGTEDAAILSLRYTYLHWGFHAWAIYATIALGIAYFKFRKGYPGLMSAALYPLLGDKVKGRTGKIIDIVAVFATIFGVCASLGLGAAQINGGLSYLTGIPNNFSMQFLIIAIVTVLFMLSAGTGLKKGIKYLSNTNLVLAVILFIAVIALGPTIFLMDLFTTTFGSYIQNLPAMGLRLSPFDVESAAWLQGWTIFYWAWWIAWAPFVGTFIARVSKGRTVREFVIAVLVLPTIVCSLWFGVFGGTGIFFEYNLGLDISGQALETALFYVYEQLPFSGLLAFITIFLISTFFITSADSATFVLGMQTTNGSTEPPNIVKYSWGIVLAASAVVLMASGGLEAMQTAIIVSAFPLTFILVLMTFSMLKSFKEETKPQPDPTTENRRFMKRRYRDNANQT
ncbi:glycine betaine uptake BCCT transporter [Evansella cellulosilytica]|uniref:Choline/carnitine/betaine transporter n=1 Tax=Evansella cellulosilytica (strain ATCC 21833 / DSM 2522 / FERM P-1141 / JCM 9156 / N-4) TaxID=649639 RepID=E6TVA8_EVAC2|nr:BCCT family transporter [Evansella cellulosilytica]ADU29792.1 choline/carnitine/betaine transporter [Evansella cellulosilytica DSM 2522]